jgi:hypothetical protein
MHAKPAVYHRDIRAPNIMKRFNDDGWFLIDWSDASKAPTRAVTHMKESEHSPRVRKDNHGPEVDIWGIGKYMEDLADHALTHIANPEAVRQMARRWMEERKTTATTALNEIEVSIYHGNMRVMY